MILADSLMRDFVETCRGERPKTSMCPWLKQTEQSFTVVDFPEPFGPSNPNTSPRRTSKSIPSTARALGRPQKSLKTLVRPRTATTSSVLPVVDCRSSIWFRAGLTSVTLMAANYLRV
jgi:hypothetical protein